MSDQFACARPIDRTGDQAVVGDGEHDVVLGDGFDQSFARWREDACSGGVAYGCEKDVCPADSVEGGFDLPAERSDAGNAGKVQRVAVR